MDQSDAGGRAGTGCLGGQDGWVVGWYFGGLVWWDGLRGEVDGSVLAQKLAVAG